jgi:hypothetical protein
VASGLQRDIQSLSRRAGTHHCATQLWCMSLFTDGIPTANMAAIVNGASRYIHILEQQINS